MGDGMISDLFNELILSFFRNWTTGMGRPNKVYWTTSLGRSEY